MNGIWMYHHRRMSNLTRHHYHHEMGRSTKAATYQRHYIATHASPSLPVSVAQPAVLSITSRRSQWARFSRPAAKRRIRHEFRSPVPIHHVVCFEARISLWRQSATAEYELTKRGWEEGCQDNSLDSQQRAGALGR